MIDYAVSLGVGLGVGVLYGVLNVRSPAPPLVALIGLLGMVLGNRDPLAALTPPARRGEAAARAVRRLVGGIDTHPGARLSGRRAARTPTRRPGR